MIKKIFSTIMFSVFCLLLVPVSSFASSSSFSYEAPAGGYDGTKACQTSYTDLVFYITHKNGLSTRAHLQKLSGGKWVTINTTLMQGRKNYKLVAKYAGSSLYRILVKADINGGTAIGTVKCVGERSAVSGL
ncbi:hypothetical protein SAMN04487866_11514 [Thermoactinomyces sp. DSM 45891]|uniref:hypothetical protein n=1 Tax=Thermoactinomyces sp. DSM 45891 TaxID=1761907 RepID=UPI00091FE9BC|nr:hypothetical protein [Thermoactinomyces sp. DSM 45891]SFX64464.1 hypothetical protein SAMN04487866_11514 [Thermoactinomyces sp. DSM 45891]